MGNSGNNRGICFGAVVGNAACGILWVGISNTLLVCILQCWGDSSGCDGAEVGESLGWKISESLSDSVCASYLLMPLTGHGNCVLWHFSLDVWSNAGKQYWTLPYGSVPDACDDVFVSGAECWIITYPDLRGGHLGQGRHWHC